MAQEETQDGDRPLIPLADKPYLSPSQIEMYLRCPRQYERRYIYGERKPPSGAMLLGRAWHRAIQVNYEYKVHAHEDLPLSDVCDAYTTAWDASVAELGKDEVLWNGEQPHKLKDKGQRLTRVHREQVAPAVVPRLIEHPFRVSLGDAFPYDLAGVIDLVEDDDTITDQKSRSRKPSQDDADRSLQLSAYSLGYSLLFGAREARMKFVVGVKKAQPEIVELYTARTNAQLRWYLDLVERVAGAIKSGDFPPNPTGWWCSPRWCGWWKECMT